MTTRIVLTPLPDGRIAIQAERHDPVLLAPGEEAHVHTWMGATVAFAGRQSWPSAEAPSASPAPVQASVGAVQADATMARPARVKGTVDAAP